MFDQMITKIRENISKVLLHLERPTIQIRPAAPKPTELVASSGNKPAKTERQKTVVNTEKTVGRNDPCPCGSGKKYKNCCGK